MKTKINRILTALLAAVLLTSAVAVLASCGGTNAKFEFTLKDAQIRYSTVVEAPYATVTVVTTCVSGRLTDDEYPHDVEGGTPWLVLSDGTLCEGRAELNCATTSVDIRKGDTLEQTWIFDIPRSFSEGSYTVRVVWFNSEQDIEGVVFNRAE